MIFSLYFSVVLYMNSQTAVYLQGHAVCSGVSVYTGDLGSSRSDTRTTKTLTSTPSRHARVQLSKEGQEEMMPFAERNDMISLCMDDLLCPAPPVDNE